MRIALVCPYNIYRMGGVQEAVLAHQRELQKRGHEVTIIAPTPRRTPEKPRPGVLTIGHSTELNTPLNTMVDVGVSLDKEQVIDIFEHHQFDIFHVHEPWVPFLGLQLLARSPAINVATFHARLPDSVFTKSFERMVKPYQKAATKKVNAITAVSDEASKMIGRITKLPVTIVPNGIELAVYDRKATKAADIYPGKQVILFVGRLEKRKGAILLLKAFRELKKTHPDVVLVIAGKGKQDRALRQYVSRYQVSDVDMIGFVSDECKRSLMKRADLYCSPAMYGESFGIVLLEAMAMGTVTVAGDNPGYRSVLKETGSGSLVDASKKKHFAKKLAYYLDNKAARDEWLTWAETYVKQFDYPIIVDRLESIYKELLEKNG